LSQAASKVVTVKTEALVERTPIVRDQFNVGVSAEDCSTFRTTLFCSMRFWHLQSSWQVLQPASATPSSSDNGGVDDSQQHPLHAHALALPLELAAVTSAQQQDRTEW